MERAVVCDTTICDAKGRMGVYSGPIDPSSNLPSGPNGLILYHEPPSALPPPPPPPAFGSKKSANQTANTTVAAAHSSLPATSPENNNTNIGTDNSAQQHSVLKYQGDWRNGHWHGLGHVYLRNGDDYKGPFYHSQKHGSDGMYKWSDGRIYQGDWKNDSRHGRGKYTWPGSNGNGNGCYYEGDFSANRRHGQGTFGDPQLGVHYTGEWKDGLYHGEGVYTWKSHDQTFEYTGQFWQGKPHGPGKEVCVTTGKVRYEGLWKAGDFQPMEGLVPPVETLRKSPTASGNNSTGGTSVATSRPPKETIVVHNQVWYMRPAEGQQQPKTSSQHQNDWTQRAIYRGLWDTKDNLPNGNGTAEFESIVTGTSTLFGSSSSGGSTYKTYDGCFEKGQFHGHGRLVFSNGDVYQGEFVQGQRHGEGTYRWVDGREYTGSFVHNERHGEHATASYPNGSFYEGDFQNGQRHGKGRFLFVEEGSLYEGDWQHGQYHGQGLLVHPDGTTYRGSFANGQPEGYGTETDSSGALVYQGEWSCGEPKDGPLQRQRPERPSKGEQRVRPRVQNPQSEKAPLPILPMAGTAQAHGDIFIADDDQDDPDDDTMAPRQAVVDEPIIDAQGNPGKYTGIVLTANRKPSGVGRLVYADGKRIHEGFWKNGRKEGHGRCLFFPQGDFHEGEYRDNLRHGQGRYQWKDGRSFQGNYTNDMREGLGVFIYPSGEKYEGNFREGRRSGQGKFRFDNGRGLYEGEWSMGKYHGVGRLVWGAGFSYKGQFRNGLFHGEGVKQDPSGNIVQKGIWQDGRYTNSEADRGEDTHPPPEIEKLNLDDTSGALMVPPPTPVGDSDSGTPLQVSTQDIEESLPEPPLLSTPSGPPVDKELDDDVVAGSGQVSHVSGDNEKVVATDETLPNTSVDTVASSDQEDEVIVPGSGVSRPDNDHHEAIKSDEISDGVLQPQTKDCQSVKVVALPYD